MNDYVALFLGLVCAGLGGETFIRGTLGLALWTRVSPGVIALIVAGFATSSPELSVAINAALAGRPEISFGNVLGSNVVNVALILGVALAISRLHCPRGSVKRDFPVALLVPVITGVLLLDGLLSRIDGLLMMGLFVTWLVAAVIEARKQRSAAEEILGEHRKWIAVVFCVGGLGVLMVAGNLIVMGAGGIASTFGMDAFVIGATVVAVGTSVPELATVIIAKLRGHDEVGLGIVLGSNVFNGLFIVAVAAIIYPIAVDWREVAVALVFGSVALAITYPTRSGLIERRRGVLLLVLYAVYLATILQRPAV
jgi:cation:H+ antiporter